MLRFGKMFQPVKIGEKKTQLTRLVRWFNSKGICHVSLMIWVWSLDPMSSGGRRELNSTVSTHWLSHVHCCRHSMIQHPFPVMQTQINVNCDMHAFNYFFIVKVFMEGLLHMPGGTASDALEFFSWPLHKRIEHKNHMTFWSSLLSAWEGMRKARIAGIQDKGQNVPKNNLGK